jgi:polysaccharide export outer membrane protein
MDVEIGKGLPYMPASQRLRTISAAACLLLLATAAVPGCSAFHSEGPVPPPIPPLGPEQQVPIEKLKVTLPPYRIEPPDILYIDAVKIVPKSPYRISPQDILTVNVIGTLPTQPIGGNMPVDAGGAIDLGPGVGRVNVAGLSLEEATEVVDRQLRRTLSNPQVSIGLAQAAGLQQIAGEHLVASDGRINLGTYGTVYIAGLTVEEARAAIETHLTRYLDNPKIAVDVGAFNSKVYYIVMSTESPSSNFNQSVSRLPITGNETVLDALSQVNGLNQFSNKHHIWISRPSPDGCGCDQILPVDWDKVTRAADTATNYQVLPGDRIFVDCDKLYATDNAIFKIVSPFERIFGFTTLGVQALFRLAHPQSSFGGSNFTSHW